MYATCLFCESHLGSNEMVEAFPVGRRLAFDESRGRLWVVCRKCERWNLSPLEERWEAIEQCDRLFRDTRLRVSTDNIGLAKLSEGLELVRIGNPLRPEFAAWRYGDQFGRRRQRAMMVGGAGAVAAVAGAPLLVASVPFLSTLAFTSWVVPWFSVPYQSAKDWVTADRVVAQVPVEGRTVAVRVKQLKESAIVVRRAGDELAIDLCHDGGTTQLQGPAAERVTGMLLAQSNVLGASRRDVQHALRRVDAVGDASSFFASASKLSRRPGGRVMAEMRRVGAFNLTAVERLALEMALHEDAERRALEGELQQLADAWKHAEEIASIVDRELSWGTGGEASSVER
jgi:hypothetical protein